MNSQQTLRNLILKQQTDMLPVRLLGGDTNAGQLLQVIQAALCRSKESGVVGPLLLQRLLHVPPLEQGLLDAAVRSQARFRVLAKRVVQLMNEGVGILRNAMHVLDPEVGVGVNSKLVHSRVVTVLQHSPPLNDPDQDHHNGNHQQEVNKPSHGDITHQPQCPQNQQNNCDRP